MTNLKFVWKGKRDGETTLLFTPLGQLKAWHRHDDIMDWIEETANYEPTNRTILLPGRAGIYPYEAGYVRVRSAPDDVVPLSKNEFVSRRGSLKDGFLAGGDYNMLVGYWDDKQEPLAEGALLGHLRNDWRPALPLMMSATLMFWKDAFGDHLDEVRRQVQPMIAIYWC